MSEPKVRFEIYDDNDPTPFPDFPMGNLRQLALSDSFQGLIAKLFLQDEKQIKAITIFDYDESKSVHFFRVDEGPDGRDDEMVQAEDGGGVDE